MAQTKTEALCAYHEPIPNCEQPVGAMHHHPGVGKHRPPEARIALDPCVIKLKDVPKSAWEQHEQGWASAASVVVTGKGVTQLLCEKLQAVS